MKFSPKHFLLGLVFGGGLLYGLIQHFPDGKLHIYFCDVGQGDSIYIRFPNNIDMLVDGGPDSKVLSCLGRFMPFYDRSIDIVVLTHPQKDHLQGLLAVLERYRTKDFVTVPVGNKAEEYVQLKTILERKKIPIKYLTYADKMEIGEAHLTVLWPQKTWMSDSIISEGTKNNLIANSVTATQTELLGLETTSDLNLYSLYIHLQYKDFDMLLTGDGDSQVQQLMELYGISEDLPEVEVLKVPHHGSNAGVSESFLSKVRPELSVISVGKNNYGHPGADTLKNLKQYGRVVQTYVEGVIEVLTDGKTWTFYKK